MGAAEDRIHQLEAKMNEAIGVLTVWVRLVHDGHRLHHESINDLAVELRRTAEPPRRAAMTDDELRGE